MRKYNFAGEIDETSNTLYIYAPPFSSKNKPNKISKTITIEDKYIINLDFYNEFLVGLEVIDINGPIKLQEINQNKK